MNGVYYSHPVKSHGGNFKACIYTSTSGKRAYALYEDDVNNYDDKVGSVRQQVAGGCETWDVSGAVDGDNHRAELYIATNDSRAYKVKYYD